MRIALAVLFALLHVAQPARAAAPEAHRAAQPAPAPAADSSPDASPNPGRQPRRVLALFWSGPYHPVTTTFDRQFEAVLTQQGAGEVVRYTEYLQPGYLPDAQQERTFRDYLRQKYSERHIDVLFCWGPATLGFLLRNHATLFPDTPIVYYASSIDAVRDLAAAPMTGVLNPGAYARTLDLALGLHPDTTQVFVISGTANHDKSIEREASQQLATFEDRVTISYLTDLPLERLLSTVRALPTRSIILYSRQSHEDPDRVLQPFDFLGPVAQAASVPVYAPWRSHLGSGVVGGVVEDPVAGATKAAEMVLRVARGERPEDIPTDRVPTGPAFDARQLARFGIAEARLPPGSLVLFREPTIWSRYRPYVLGTLAVVGLQTLLIGALLVQRNRRRRVETALRESETRYVLATAAAAVGVWERNFETGDIYVDPAVGRALGLTDADIDAGAHAWTWLLCVEGSGRWRADVQACVDGTTAFFEVEQRRVLGDGSTRWFLVRGAVAQRDAARATRMTGTVMDITDRKRAELNLDTTRHELARVARVTSLAQSAAHTAHELSQPLAAIQMNVGACLRWLSGPRVPTDEVHGALLDAAQAAALASGIVARDREVFRRHSAEKQVIDVNGIVTDVVSLLRARLQHTGTRLDLRLEPELPPVRGDRVELQQVLLNLLLNGIEALEVADSAGRRLTIATRLADNQVQTTVEDTGPGIGDADVEHLFTPFFTTKSRGTGIGLSISRLIVEDHGGSLWADRSSGRGARFHFTVPVAAAEATGRVPGTRAS